MSLTMVPQQRQATSCDQEMSDGNPKDAPRLRGGTSYDENICKVHSATLQESLILSNSELAIRDTDAVTEDISLPSNDGYFNEDHSIVIQGAAVAPIDGALSRNFTKVQHDVPLPFTDGGAHDGLTTMPSSTLAGTIEDNFDGISTMTTTCPPNGAMASGDENSGNDLTVLQSSHDKVAIRELVMAPRLGAATSDDNSGNKTATFASGTPVLSCEKGSGFGNSAVPMPSVDEASCGDLAFVPSGIPVTSAGGKGIGKENEGALDDGYFPSSNERSSCDTDVPQGSTAEASNDDGPPNSRKQGPYSDMNPAATPLPSRDKEGFNRVQHAAAFQVGAVSPDDDDSRTREAVESGDVPVSSRDIESSGDNPIVPDVPLPSNEEGPQKGRESPQGEIVAGDEKPDTHGASLASEVLNDDSSRRDRTSVPDNVPLPPDNGFAGRDHTMVPESEPVLSYEVNSSGDPTAMPRDAPMPSNAGASQHEDTMAPPSKLIPSADDIAPKGNPAVTQAPSNAKESSTNDTMPCPTTKPVTSIEARSGRDRITNRYKVNGVIRRPCICANSDECRAMMAFWCEAVDENHNCRDPCRAGYIRLPVYQPNAKSPIQNYKNSLRLSFLGHVRPAGSTPSARWLATTRRQGKNTGTSQFDIACELASHRLVTYVLRLLLYCCSRVYCSSSFPS